MDGESAIATAKPNIFGNEKRTFKINVVEVKRNAVNKREPSPKSRYRARIGTTAQLLSDGQAQSTAPIDTLRASATLVTAPSQQAKGSGLVYTYTGVTAAVSASIATFPIVTGTFVGQVFYQAPVTATILATIATQSASITTKSLLVETSGIGESFLLNPSFIDEPYAIASTLNSPVTATFVATVLAGAVVKVDITNKGFGYPSGTYALTFSGGGPTTTASVNAIANSGYIQSTTIFDGGTGYSSTPTVTLFGPAKSLAKTGELFVELGYKGQDTTAYSLTFPDPDNTGTPPLPSKPVGTINWQSEGLWRINITNAGYGYSNPITVGHQDIYGYMPIISIQNIAEPLPNTQGFISDLKMPGGGNTILGANIFKTAVTYSSELSKISPYSLRFVSSKIRDTQIGTSALLLKWLLGDSWINSNTVRPITNTIPLEADGQSSSLFPGLGSEPLGLLSFRNLASQLASQGIITPFSIHDPKSIYVPLISLTNPAQEIRKQKELETLRKQLDIARQQEQRFSQQARYLSTSQLNFGRSTGSVIGPSPVGSQGIVSAIAKLSKNSQQFDLTGLRTPYEQLTKNGRVITGTQYGSISAVWLDVVSNQKEVPNSANHAQFAEKKAKFALVPTDRSFSPSRYAVVEIEIPKPEQTFICVSFSKDTPERRLGMFHKGRGFVGNSGAYLDRLGGRYNPILRVLDPGADYSTNYFGSYDLVELGSIKAGDVLFETPANISVILPETLEQGFVDGDFSKDATISTAPGGYATEYFLDFGGIGYTGQNVNIGFKAVSTLGHIKSVSLSNVPKNYTDGSFSCEVQQPPTGTRATVNLVVSNGVAEAVVLNGGFGYTSIPTITAPNPNFVSGQLVALRVVTRPDGYSLNKNFYLTVPISSVTDGNAVAYFSIDASGIVNTTIENPGFGYQANLVATAPDPDQRLASGYIQSLFLNNSPEGYEIGKSYDLNIQASPQSGGTAQARLVRTDNTKYEIQLLSAGAGYTSSPIVTAPGFDAPNGKVFAVTATNLGLGYAPGTYEATVTTAPAGGKTAIISFIRTADGDSIFNVQDQGYGYVNQPSVVVPTPAGNVVNSITIVCGGSYYNSDNVSPAIIDATGVGASLNSPEIQGGEILAVNVFNRGYGYSNNPQITFNKPAAPAIQTLELNQFVNDFNITTASANAILTTANQRDVLLEVYETDGTNEQVVAQATVSLAKRVLE